MYPRNSASPPVIDMGEVIQKSDGAQQTSGVLFRVKIGTGAWGAAAGTPAFDATSGIWTYAPTQAETNAEFFIVAAYKAGCTSISKTIVTSASPVAGTVDVEQWAGQSVGVDSDNIPVVSVQNYYESSLTSWLPIAGRFATIAGVTNKLDSMIEPDGGGHFRFDTIAMSMAPAGGGGGGGNPWLTDIGTGYTGTQAGKVLMDAKLKTDLITTGGVVYVDTMVNPDGEIDKDIVIGNDYLHANSRSFSWDFTPPPGFVLGTSTCRFGGRHERSSVASSWLLNGTLIDNGNGTWKARFDFPRADTGALTEGKHKFSVDVVNASGIVVTIAKSGREANVVRKQS